MKKNPGNFVLKRVNRKDDGGTELWPDYSVNDYIYRDDELKHLSFYEFVCNYCNNPFTFKHMRKRDLTVDCPSSVKTSLRSRKVILGGVTPV